MNPLVKLGVILLIAACCEVHGSASTPLLYLEKYGYYKPPVNTFSTSNAHKTEMNSIKQFQKFAGLNITGRIDKATLSKMTSPRCGMKDIDDSSNNKVLFNGNPRRKWSRFDLTYYIRSLTKDLSNDTIDAVIGKAFEVWQNVSSFKFHQKRDLSADIIVSFLTGNHKDSFDFDGPGGVIAHAFPPPIGDIHFDDAETFTEEIDQGINLLWTAVHEIGHSLGLKHSNVQGSIMYPYYSVTSKQINLDASDVSALNAIYGSRTTTPQPTLQPTHKSSTKTQAGHTTHVKSTQKQTTSNPSCNNKLRDRYCESWKRHGYCSNNHQVRINCKKSCDLC